MNRYAIKCHILLPVIILTLSGCQSHPSPHFVATTQSMACTPRRDQIDISHAMCMLLVHSYLVYEKPYFEKQKKSLQEEFPIKAGMSLKDLNPLSAKGDNTIRELFRGTKIHDDDLYSFSIYKFAPGINNETGYASARFSGPRHLSGYCIIKVQNNIITSVWIHLTFGEYTLGVYELLSGDGSKMFFPLLTPDYPIE